MALPPLGKAVADAAPLDAFEEIEGLDHYALLEDPQSCAAATCAAEKVLS